MEIFCQGDLSTPKLQQVQLADEENMQWEGNLTIKQMFEEKVGYSGLKHLKFSEILVLLNIWNSNPQEISRFKNLEHLEVCDSNDLKCIFNLSIASSLCRLQQLEIRRCNNLEVVIEEEEASITRDDKTMIIFPLLKSIIIEACPDLRSFYRGRTSLAKFEVSHCPNMTAFISTFSRDEDKLATIEGNNDLITSFFCYEKSDLWNKTKDLSSGVDYAQGRIDTPKNARQRRIGLRFPSQISHPWTVDNHNYVAVVVVQNPTAMSALVCRLDLLLQLPSPFKALLPFEFN
ncbi:hypothetical protein CCACVL1_02673 [Corchorus capsularis]|uniref:Disease resistance protein At4g27190-like leucine-rich repeats domain-containing protein n=1 Tax=Corchorus capsularis TaxID=210143 RepID=A0A1R3K6Z0_COCAP|nr:hypothetical protein CCACVL1_02673 [Corchorus capsularis]